MAQIIYTREEQEELDARLSGERLAREFALLLYEAAWRSIRAGTAAPDEFDETFDGEMLEEIKALGAGKKTKAISRLRLKLTPEEQQRVRYWQATGMSKETAKLATEAEILLSLAEATAPDVAATRHRYPKQRYKRIKRRLAEFERIDRELAEEIKGAAFEDRPENVCIHVRSDGSDTYLYDFEGTTWHRLDSFEETDDGLNISYSKCGVRFMGDGTKDIQLMRVYLVFHMSCTERSDVAICRECLPDLKHPPRLDLSPKEEMADA